MSKKIKITEAQYLDYVDPYNHKGRHNRITKKQVDEQFVNYKIIYSFQHSTSILNESEDNTTPSYTVPAQEAKQIIFKKYHLQDWQFNIEKRRGDIEVILLIPAIDENPKMIAADMEKLGYFYAKGAGIKLQGRNYLRLQFEPRFQPDISNQIRYEGVLFHLTPAKNLPSILKNGLMPSARNTIFSYPDRIFFLRGTVNIKEIIMLARNLVQSKVCAIITIDARNLPNTIKFHIDPNLDDYGVFTEQPVSSQYFAGITKVNLTTNQIIKS